MNNDGKIDKLTEWIKKTIEQGDDRPLLIPNVQNAGSQNANQHSTKKVQNKPQSSQKSYPQNSQHPPRKPSNQQHQNRNNNFKFNKIKVNMNQEMKRETVESRPAASQGNNPQKNNQAQAQKLPVQGQKQAPQRHQAHQQQAPNQQPKRQQQHTGNFQKPGSKPTGKPQPLAGNSPQHSAKPPKRRPNNRPEPKPKRDKPKPKALTAFKGLRIIPIGGLNEVGKNMTAYEYNRTGNPTDKEIIVIDMGLQFPEEDMLGVDYVIPDSAYLEENKKKIKAVIITHGHLDHTGGIPYILPKIDFPPVYATKLTRGLIEGRIEEFKLEKYVKLHTINPKESLKFGSFKVDFFRVAHSIPDSVGIIVDTPEGKIVHTGDFKFDDSPAGIQEKADLDKIRALGSQNVMALLSDSTNALKPGHTMSEAEIGNNLERLIMEAKGRVIIASFSSLIGRIQQIFEYAEKTHRKIYISGRSMKENVQLALNLGYLKIHTNIMHDIKKLGDAPDNETLILTTGSQGEAVSALTKIAMNDHPQVHIKKGDTVIVSSTPIIGNERSIFTVINNLSMLGAKVIHSQISNIHTSGHGYQEELKQMIQMVRPKYFIPVHGEYFMRQGHRDLAIDCGIPEHNCIMVQNGDVVEITKQPQAAAGNSQVRIGHDKVESKYILIDGLGEGTIGSQVMVERQRMSTNGILVIILSINSKNKKLLGEPNILSRGFIYMHEYAEITAELGALVADAYKQFIKKKPDADRKEIKYYIQGVAERYTHQKLERKPLILPLVFEN